MPFIAQRFYLIFACMYYVFFASCAAGPIAFQTDLYRYSTKHFWNKNNKRLPTYNHFNLNACELILSYNINQDNCLAFRSSYDKIKEELHGATQGFEDLEAAWVTRLGQSHSPFYSQLLAIIPTGKSKHSLRYGQFGFEGSLLYSNGCLLFDRYLWGCARLGYRYYAGFPSDQIRGDLGFFWQAAPLLNLVSQFNLEYGLFNGKRREHYNTILLNPNYRLLKFRIELLVKLNNFSFFDFGYFQHIWGQNVGTGGGLVAGLVIYY